MLNFIESQTSSLEQNGFGLSGAFQASIIAMYSVTFVIALFGNILLIHIIRERRPINAVSILIINMAASDLLAALFTMPYTVAYVYVQTRWFGGIAGAISCKIVQFVIGSAIASSIFALLAISVERYVAVVKPILYPSFVKRPVLLSAAIWLSSLIFMGVNLYVFQTVTDDNDVTHCFSNWESLMCKELSPKIFYTAVAILLYILPLVVIAVLSALIINKLRSQKQPDSGLQLPTHELNFHKRNHLVMRMLLAIVVLFAVCWLPVHVLHLLLFFKEEVYISLPTSVVLSLFWISHANSAINPCVVILLNGSFRTSVMNKFHRLGCNLCCRGNRVNCLEHGNNLQFVARRKGSFSLDNWALRWSKQDGRSPVALLDIRTIPA